MKRGEQCSNTIFEERDLYKRKNSYVCERYFLAQRVVKAAVHHRHLCSLVDDILLRVAVAKRAVGTRNNRKEREQHLLPSSV